jgi:hypothetical protein
MFFKRLASTRPGIPRLAPPQSKLPRVHLLTICAVIFLTSLGIRLLYWQDNYAELARGKRISGLQMVAFFYYDQAQRILDDRSVLFPRNPIQEGDATVLTHPPGYSVLMAAVFKMFCEPGAEQGLAQADAGLRVIQIIGDAASAVVIFLIVAELLPLAAAIIAAILCSFSPHLAFYSLMLAPDSLSVLPLLVAVYLIIRAIRRPSLVTIVTAGALVGLSCWLRSNALLLAPFLALIVWLLFERGRRLRYSLALICAAVVMIAPIIIRNWIVFHHFVPISILAGVNLVEGIGDYDKENRFGMPRNDAECALKDAEWYGRPDYANAFWKPDGVERDRARFARGLAVVRTNPGWFFGVMMRRMEFMLRYNDFRPQLANVTTAPAVSAFPTFGHKLEFADATTRAWSSSATQLMANGNVALDHAQTALQDDGDTLQIAADESANGNLFFSEPIAVKKETDYVLRLTVRLEQGDMGAKIATADPRIILASTSISQAMKMRKPDESGPPALDHERMRELLLPFASDRHTEVRLSLFKSGVDPTVVKMGQAEMFESGATPYLWTRYPRALIRGIQKNVFKTDLARLLIAIGVILLGLAHRGRALAILLIIPVYYLLAQSPLHTEYRYILAIHYFLFVIAAVTIYWAGSIIGQVGRQGWLFARRESARFAGAMREG